MQNRHKVILIVLWEPPPFSQSPKRKPPKLISSEFGFGLEIKLEACLKWWDENFNVLIDPRGWKPMWHVVCGVAT